MKNETHDKVSISLPHSLLGRVDSLAGLDRRDRSNMVALLLEIGMKHYRPSPTLTGD